jgi:hypothetical protein
MAERDDVAILAQVISSLKPLESGERLRLLQTVAAFFGDVLQSSLASPSPGRISEHATAAHHRAPPLSHERVESPKSFVMQKDPRTDVERVAVLGYFLVHHRDTPFFKTVDISRLNTEAAQPKFSNAALAVGNAVKTGYLAAGGKGQKQVSGAGERFVEALPDRVAAKAAMEAARAHRKRRKKAARGNGSRN